jgi:hypothetical protein
MSVARTKGWILGLLVSGCAHADATPAPVTSVDREPRPAATSVDGEAGPVQQHEQPYDAGCAYPDASTSVPAPVTFVDHKPCPEQQYDFCFENGDGPWELNFDTRVNGPCSQARAAEYLEIWKQLFEKLNGFDEAAFHAHIHVIGASIVESRRFVAQGGPVTSDFNVAYVYELGWAHIVVEDWLSEPVLAAHELTTLERAARGDRGVQDVAKIRRLDPSPRIASKAAIIAALRRADPRLAVSVRQLALWRRCRDPGCSDREEFSIKVGGAVDGPANKCLEATVWLRDAAVVGLRRSVCSVQ